tara:strand:+ start:5158 stop:5346 length:189 start_codon:yes stop_codon:yes gene_type:complete
MTTIQKKLSYDIEGRFYLLNDASLDFISKLDRERFLIDPSYSKTIFACYKLNLITPHDTSRR